MNTDKLKSLQIDRMQKRRPQGMLWVIFLVILGATGTALYLARPKPEDKIRVLQDGPRPPTNAAPTRLAGYSVSRQF